MKKRFIKWGIIIILSGLIIGGGIIFYMFNQPHRNIQAITSDYQMKASTLVKDYLTDATLANEKYLQDDGESKIITVTGTIASITEDLNQQQVVLLKGKNEKAGVSCTFTSETNGNTKNLKIGETVTIKGVIRSGAGYDEDLELYEDVILEKCDVVNN
ncbi:OB-fold protein [Lutibacter sp.]